MKSMILTKLLKSELYDLCLMFFYLLRQGLEFIKIIKIIEYIFFLSSNNLSFQNSHES